MKMMMKKHVNLLGFLMLLFFVFMLGCSSVQYKLADLNYMAKYKVSIGDLRGSIPELEKALKLDPKDVNANVTMAQVQYRLGDIKKAEKYARTAYAVRPDDFRAMGILGLIDIRHGEYEKGIELVSEAMKAYNVIEPVGGSVPVEPEVLLENMKTELKNGKKVSPDLISQLEGAFFKKIQWYEFDEEYRKWHFYSFYDPRPDGGNSYPK